MDSELVRVADGARVERGDRGRQLSDSGLRVAALQGEHSERAPRPHLVLSIAQPHGRLERATGVMLAVVVAPEYGFEHRETGEAVVERLRGCELLDDLHRFQRMLVCALQVAAVPLDLCVHEQRVAEVAERACGTVGGDCAPARRRAASTSPAYSSVDAASATTMRPSALFSTSCAHRHASVHRLANSTGEQALERDDVTQIRVVHRSHAGKLPSTLRELERPPECRAGGEPPSRRL